MIQEESIRSIVNQFLDGREGLYLLDTTIKGSNKIYVTIDHDSEPIGIDLIVELTKHIEENLDREEEDFDLEVSSAGLTTPLATARRYRKYLGKEIEVYLKSGKREEGDLLEVTDEYIVLKTIKKEKMEGKKRKELVTHELKLPYDEINRATYLLRF